MQAWPFLITRNPELDYRTVVVPTFLAGKGNDDFLPNELDMEEPTGERQLTYQNQLRRTPAGPITVAHRTVFAERNGKRLRDESGRPVLRMEGLIFSGHCTGEDLPEELPNGCEALLDDAFAEFWTLDSPQRPRRSASIVLGPEPSLPLEVEAAPSDEDHEIPEPPPPVPPEDWRRFERWLILTIVAMTLLMGIGLWWLRVDNHSVTKAKTEERIETPAQLPDYRRPPHLTGFRNNPHR